MMGVSAGKRRAAAMAAVVAILGRPLGGDEGVRAVLDRFESGAGGCGGVGPAAGRAGGRAAGGGGGGGGGGGKLPGWAKRKLAIAKLPERDRNADPLVMAWPRMDNSTAAERDGVLVPTTDRHDRAHAHRDPVGMLNAAAALPESQSQPRKYPKRMLNAAGLSIDAQCDALYEAQFRMVRELGEVPGICVHSEDRLSTAETVFLARRAGCRVGLRETRKQAVGRSLRGRNA